MDNPEDALRTQVMRRAIEKAREATASGNYPVGAVVARGDEVLSSAFTSLHSSLDPTAHAEVLAIRGAAEATGSISPEGCQLYSTLEPCPMCTSAAIWARMSSITFGASQADAEKHAAKASGGRFTWRQIDIRCEYIAARGNPVVEVRAGVMRQECLALFQLG